MQNPRLHCRASDQNLHFANIPGNLFAHSSVKSAGRRLRGWRYHYQLWTQMFLQEGALKESKDVAGGASD